MTVLASDIMRRAGLLLQDVDHIRWTPAELAEWLNDGVRSIVLAKPSEATATRYIQLIEGTMQTVPSDAPQPQLILSITRNIRQTDPVVLAGRSISATSRLALDASCPDWHDERRVRRRKEVIQHFIDAEDPLRFWVYPGNDGSGVVEAIVSIVPAPVEATGDPALEASYDVSTGLKDAMATPMLDYVLFRAHSKDDVAASAERAQGHFQAFAAAIGLKITNQAKGQPGTRRNG